MSSLFDQLSSSGGAERKSTTSSTSSYYHTPPKTANHPGGLRWSDRVNHYERDWDKKVNHYSSPRARPRTSTSKQQSKNQTNTNLQIRSYRQTDTSRPYAYEPASNEVGWVRPTWQEVLKDLMWKITESMIAAAGMAVAEFFLHRRFHPGPGVKW